MISPTKKGTNCSDEPVGTVTTNLDHLNLLSSSSHSIFVKRNIILDESNFTEKFLKCIICDEIYDNGDRQPKLLPCHHTLCSICIIKLFLAEAEYRRSLTPAITDLPNAVTIICPRCSGNFISTREGIRQLPTDHRIIQLLDFLDHTDIQTVQYCHKHKTQPINFFCECCVKLICRDCTILDHKEINGHIVRDLDGAVKTYNPIIEEAMSELESEKNTLKEKRLAMEQSIETADKSEHDVVEHVKSSFAVLRAALEEREKQLIAMAEKEVGNEKQTLREKLDLIDKRSGDIDEKYQELKRCKEEGNVEDMFKVTQNIRDYKPLDPLRGRDLDDGGVTKFTFNDRDEKYLSVKLQNYGDIHASARMGSTLPSSRTSSTSSYSMPYRYSYSRP